MKLFQGIAYRSYEEHERLRREVPPMRNSPHFQPMPEEEVKRLLAVLVRHGMLLEFLRVLGGEGDA